jgi:NAD+-dependent farnesol dehydrogenase
MRVLLTGGTGYLGQHIARALVARGHELTVFSRSATNGGLLGRALNGDIRDRRAVAQAAAGCDAIVHTAALVSIWQKSGATIFDDVNVGGFRNVIDAAAEHGVKRIVYTSSFLALPPADSPVPIQANDYARTKILAERLANDAIQSGAPIVRVYPGVIYGPGTRATEGNLVGRMIADHMRWRLPALVGPEKIWSFSYVDDVAAGHCAAVERGTIGGRYALGGDNAPQRRAFEIVQQLTGRRPPFRMPFSAAVALGVVETARARLFGGMPLVTPGTVEILRHDWPLDSRDAVRDLGYTMTPLSQGIANTVSSL